jgi:maleylacetoacetate isomerase
MIMKLYSFFNSSTSYRVRIALALKGLDYEYAAINLRAGEQRESHYRNLSPAGIVPTLVDGDIKLTQSLAIIDYLDQVYPVPRLVPELTRLRISALEIAQTIACEIHPINNLRVLNYLTGQLAVTADARTVWYKHWVEEGLAAVEDLLADGLSGDYCVGDAATVADCCLIPQVANALRMGCDVEKFVRIQQIYRHCISLPAFIKAAPHNQIDFLQ